MDPNGARARIVQHSGVPRPGSATANDLTDGVVTLAPYEMADAVTILRLDADRETQRWFDWPLTPDPDDRVTYAERLASAERTVLDKRSCWSAGTEYAFIIRSVETAQGLGWVSVQPLGSGRGNISYAVLPSSRRRGVATRSVALVCRFACDVLALVRLEIKVLADNLASRAVAEKAGFVLEGTLRSYGAFEKHEPLIGQRFDWVIYGRV